MSAPANDGNVKPRLAQRLLRPAVILPISAVVLVAVVLLTPQLRGARDGDGRLTTYSTSPLGAKVLHELARRFGWTTVRRTDAEMPAPDARTVLAVLAPPIPLSESDVHAVLQHVRAGGALLYALGGGPLDDSLHLESGRAGTLVPAPLAMGETDWCRKGNDGAVMLWPGDPYMSAVHWAPGMKPAAVTVLATRLANDTAAAIAVAFPLGRGRVVVYADPDMLRNDVLRVCHWRADVVAARALTYLAGGASEPRRRIVFDEYHQGYGLHPGTVGAVLTFLGRTVPGRVLGQLLLGCVVLVFAVGARTVPPREEPPPERRSPLEHVDALGRAYEQAGASRTVVERLVRGVRRRLERRGVPLRRSAGDAEFLAWVASRHPARQEDVEVVRRTLVAPASRQELERAGEALSRIEETLSTPTR